MINQMIHPSMHLNSHAKHSAVFALAGGSVASGHGQSDNFIQMYYVSG